MLLTTILVSRKTGKSGPKVRDTGKEFFRWESIQSIGLENFDIEWFRGINGPVVLDPVLFKRTFPSRVNDDGSLSGYLETDDCFVDRDTDASTDLILSRIVNINELSTKWNQSRRVVK